MTNNQSVEEYMEELDREQHDKQITQEPDGEGVCNED